MMPMAQKCCVKCSWSARILLIGTESRRVIMTKWPLGTGWMYNHFISTVIRLYMGKKQVRHGHFKSCRSPTWVFIKTVECDVKVLQKVTWWHREKIKSDVRHSRNYLDPCGALVMTALKWYIYMIGSNSKARTASDWRNTLPVLEMPLLDNSFLKKLSLPMRMI